MEEVKKKKKRKKYKKRKKIDKRSYQSALNGFKKVNYQIILTSKGRRLEYLGYYNTELQANRAFTKMVEENKKVVFPVETICLDNSNKQSDAKYELVIIKRRDEKESNITKIRNEYGDYIEHTTDNEGWVVYDKAPYHKEESFWVYGYHPNIQRKDFMFVYNEIVKPKTTYRSSFLTIYIYKNKVLFETSDSLDMVICKNKKDSIRFYNLLKELCDNDKKAKYYLFNGDWSLTRDRKEKCEEKIQKLTNWDLLKIRRSSTKP